MSNLPKYMQIVEEKESGFEGFTIFYAKVKWWGWPIVIVRLFLRRVFKGVPIWQEQQQRR